MNACKSEGGAGDTGRAGRAQRVTWQQWQAARLTEVNYFRVSSRRERSQLFTDAGC